MTPRIRKLAAIAGTTALLGGAVAGCGSSATTSDATGATAGVQQQSAPAPGQGGGGPGGLSSATLKTLASKLGVTTTALQTALQAARPTGQPGTSSPGTQADPRTQMAAAIASSLDLSTAKVEAALAAVMPAPPAGAPPQGTATTSAS